jgi:hypothetical protein
MTNDERMPKPEAQMRGQRAAFLISDFVLHSSFVIRHSDL